MRISLKDAKANPRLRKALGMKEAKPKLRLAGEFRSRLEADRARYLNGLKRIGRIDSWSYEPLTFHLPGGVRYTPDFMLRTLYPVKTVILEEVKGSWKSKNARDSRTRLKITAGMYPEFAFRAVTKENGTWKEEPIP